MCEKRNFRLIFIHLHKFLLAATCRMRNLLAKQRTTICRSFSFRISRFFSGFSALQMPLPRCDQCTIQDNDDNDDNDDDNGDDVDVDAVDDGATKCYTHLNKIHIYHYA